MSQEAQATSLGIEIPMMLNKEKRQFKLNKELFQIEKGEIIECSLHLYEVAMPYRAPKCLIITTSWSEALELLDEEIDCNGSMITYHNQTNILIPNRLIHEEIVLVFRLRVKDTRLEGFDLQFSINYEYQNKRKLEKERLRLYSPKVYCTIIEPKLTMTLEQMPKPNKGIDIVGYQVHIRNEGNITLNHVRCHKYLPRGCYDVKQSLRINGEIPIIVEMNPVIDLRSVVPQEYIEISFEILIVQAELIRGKGIYIEAEYTYDKSREISQKSYSNSIVLKPFCKEEREVIQRNDMEHRRTKSCERGVKVEQKASINKSANTPLFHYEIWIENRGDKPIKEIYMMYIIYYKLRVLPHTLEMNANPIKGGISRLRLPWIGEKGHHQCKAIISFDAVIRKEFENVMFKNKNYNIQSRVRFKYLTPSGRWVTTLANSIKLCENKIGDTTVNPSIVQIQEICLPKNYKPIFRIEQIKLEIENVVYTIIIGYYSELGRHFAYMYTSTLEGLGLDLNRPVYGEIQDETVLINEWLLQVKLKLWNG